MASVVLITGCSSGIGRASALALARAGATVFATARRPDAIADLRDAGCHTLALDVTDEASMRDAVDAVEREHGAVDVLVNNAGYGQQGALEETSIDLFRAQFETNVFGPVRLCQLVNLFDRGQPVKMSKRAGTVVTAREVVDEVGKDVVRFMMLTRKNDAALDFDYAKVKEQSKDNPVFYVQYAHARCRSVFRQAAETMPDLDVFDANLAKSALERLTDSGEMRLIKTLAAWPRAIEGAAEAHEPHRIAFYLADLAADFHGHWNRGKEDAQLRFVREDDRGLTLARLALVRAVGHVIASGLRIFGVEPVEEMC